MLANHNVLVSTIAETNVAEGGAVELAGVVSTTAVFAAATASANTLVTADIRPSGVPIPCGSGTRSTPSAAWAPASEAMWESSVLETPSSTISAARTPGVSEAINAIASSLRECLMPRSQTPATQLAGCSRKWSRSVGALVPQFSQ